MRLAPSVCCALLAIVFATPAEALPKRQTPQPINNNCTSAQLNTPAGKQCLAQLDNDIVNGSHLTHLVYCSSSGAVLCCLTDGFAIMNHSCSVNY